MNTPQAPKNAKTITQHGQTRTDNYAWLRDKNWKKFIAGDLDFADPEVKKYLDSEAEYTKHKMQVCEDLQSQLYDEILGRTKEDDESYPYQKNNYFYYTRTEKGKNYAIYCRKKDSINNPEEIFFDVNEEAKDHKLYLHRDGSTNHSNELFAYSYNLTGSMSNTIKLRDLSTSKDFPWELNDTSGFWWHDDQTLLFIEVDEFSRGKNLYSMNVHEGLSSKKLLFSKPEKYNNRFMWLSVSKDKQLYTIYLQSGSSLAIYLKTRDEPEFNFFKETKDDIKYSFEHKNGSLFILTNDFNNKNFALFKTNFTQLNTSDQWGLLIPGSNDIYLQYFTVYGGKIILTSKNNEKALAELIIFDINDQTQKIITMPDEIYSVGVIGAYDPNSETIYLGYESPKQPPQDLELNLTTGNYKVLKSKEIPNFNPDLYEVKREYATGHDGKQIPLSVLYKKDLPAGTERKTYIYAYGSYGMGMPAFFSPNIFSLCDRGFTFVVAHIRGGDDKGYDWYLDGKMHNKLNTFKDYISSCEHFINSGSAKKGEIVAHGGSAGGLLMGAVTNMRPDLFKCVIADVAFVDVINTISDETLPLTPPEWEEWGNPIINKDDFTYMMSYSPYDNIESKDYPAMLYNSGISDEQVTYWEPAKMVAKLREHKTDNNDLLLNIKMHAGHAGASARYEAIKDRAFNYAFILNSFKN